MGGRRLGGGTVNEGQAPRCLAWFRRRGCVGIRRLFFCLGCHEEFAVKVYQKSVWFMAPLAWLVNVMVDYVYSISG